MSEPVRTAIVTGASSGIGAATAIELGRLGWRVALGGRRTERLDETAKQVESAGGSALPAHLDVTCPDSIDSFCSRVESEFGDLDVLINNAGQNRSALIAEASEDQLRSDVEVNLLGAIWMTRRVLAGMIERRLGDILFVGSDTATHPRPFQSAYGAAKAGLEVFARTLEMETEGTGVRSILLRVGPTSSEFGNQMDKERMNEMLESWKYWGVLRSLHWMPAESVARAIARAVCIPVDESYPTIIEIQPGGRSKEFQST
ncbi:MAG: SDR family NAD(P)-dependent oxidoreductase [bacterium]|nr:SDR family NAD(P)-dependent oxidoreductase [bacterium]